MEGGYFVDTDHPELADIAEAWRRIHNVYSWCAEHKTLLEVCEEIHICPEGLLRSDDLERFIELETMSATYHVAPVQGSLEDMPALMFDAFLTIRNTIQQCEKERIRDARNAT